MQRYLITAVILLLGASTFAALAQDWPTRTVRIIVPFAAGATPDVVARMLADELQQRTGQTFLVENRPGASGNTGTEAVAKAMPDGSTLGVSIGGPLAINTLLFSHLGYDPKTDLALITTLATQPSALAVNTRLGVTSVTELMDLIRRNAGKYSFGSIGTGSLSHLAMAAIAQQSGANLVHVPYPSSPQAMMALIRGDVQMVCLPAAAVVPQLGTGAVRLLAVTTAERSALLPDVPTMKEAGIDVEADAWNGLIAPAGLPAALIDRIGKLAADALNSPAIREKLAAQLMEPIPGTPAAFRARIEADITRWRPVIEAAKITIN